MKLLTQSNTDSLGSRYADENNCSEGLLRQWPPHVLHDPPAQPPHPPPVPLIVCVAPFPPLLKAAKSEIARDVCMLSQCLHWMGSSALLIGRNASNLVRQSLHRYS